MNGIGDPLAWILVIAEDELDGYEPVAVASTLAEAESLARADFSRRLRLLEQGDDPGLCPYHYRFWIRRGGGYESDGGMTP
jgi:hypothetical protein